VEFLCPLIAPKEFAITRSIPILYPTSRFPDIRVPGPTFSVTAAGIEECSVFVDGVFELMCTGPATIFRCESRLLCRVN
jgi:hypothetical protein